MGAGDSGDLLGADLSGWLLLIAAAVAAVLLGVFLLGAAGIIAIAAVGSGAASPSSPSDTAPALVSERAANQPRGGSARPQQPAPPTSALGLVPAWQARAPWNQYARASYESDRSWATWRDASCSAAALAWLLGAYGQPVGSLDEAIALVGPGTGISPQLGLLDARGPALARSLSRHGLKPRTPGRPLQSIGELKSWLDQGPLLMDGRRWFGAGHWFVAIGYDGAGIHIRDSSGWDYRYLPWSRLYGEVGFSGWVVGVSK